MTKRILLLSVSPKYSEHIEQRNSNAEFRDIIDIAIQRSKYRDSIVYQQEGATRINDIRQHLLTFEPHIVHYSGLASEQGLCFENDDGTPKLIPIDAFVGPK